VLTVEMKGFKANIVQDRHAGTCDMQARFMCVLRVCV
jgi:hypothetical protein